MSWSNNFYLFLWFSCYFDGWFIVTRRNCLLENWGWFDLIDIVSGQDFDVSLCCAKGSYDWFPLIICLNPLMWRLHDALDCSGRLLSIVHGRWKHFILRLNKRLVRCRDALEMRFVQLFRLLNPSRCTCCTVTYVYTLRIKMKLMEMCIHYTWAEKLP